MKKRLFKYRAVDSFGEPVEGTMDESSAEQVTKLLVERGIQVNSVQPMVVESGGRRSGRPLEWNDISMFNDQLLAITKSKLPLAPSIKALSRDLKAGRLKGVLDELHKELELGKSLEEALRNNAASFPSMYVRLIQAGEQTGNLAGVLEIMNSHSTRMVDIKTKLRTALAYPAMVVVSSIFVILFILIEIIPEYVTIFKEFGAGLPAPTEFLVFLSDIVINHQLRLAIGTVILILVGFGLRHVFGATIRGREIFDRIFLMTPFLGKVFRTSSLARFSQTLGLMLSSRMPVIESLDLASAASGNAVLQKHANKAAIEIAKGEKLADALSDTGYFPHGYCWFLANGEAYQNLPNVLLDVGRSYEKDVAQSDEGLLFLLGPVIVVALGIFLGFVVVSMYLPIFSLGDAIQG